MALAVSWPNRYRLNPNANPLTMSVLRITLANRTRPASSATRRPLRASRTRSRRKAAGVDMGDPLVNPSGDANPQAAT